MKNYNLIFLRSYLFCSYYLRILCLDPKPYYVYILIFIHCMSRKKVIKKKKQIFDQLHSSNDKNQS
jgi:hypothetical protein